MHKSIQPAQDPIQPFQHQIQSPGSNQPTSMFLTKTKTIIGGWDGSLPRRIIVPSIVLSQGFLIKSGSDQEDLYSHLHSPQRNFRTGIHHGLSCSKRQCFNNWAIFMREIHHFDRSIPDTWNTWRKQTQPPRRHHAHRRLNLNYHYIFEGS